MNKITFYHNVSFSVPSPIEAVVGLLNSSLLLAANRGFWVWKYLRQGVFILGWYWSQLNYVQFLCYIFHINEILFNLKYTVFLRISNAAGINQRNLTNVFVHQIVLIGKKSQFNVTLYQNNASVQDLAFLFCCNCNVFKSRRCSYIFMIKSTLFTVISHDLIYIWCDTCVKLLVLFRTIHDTRTSGLILIL